MGKLGYKTMIQSMSRFCTERFLKFYILLSVLVMVFIQIILMQKEADDALVFAAKEDLLTEISTVTTTYGTLTATSHTTTISTTISTTMSTTTMYDMEYNDDRPLLKQ